MTKRYFKERIRITKALGLDYYSFHAGFRVDYRIGIHKYDDVMDRDKAMHLFICELAEISEYAESQKIHIGVENHVAIIENKDNLILYEKEDWSTLFSELSSEYLHLHLDLGHLKITSNEHGFDRFEFLKLFGHRVMALHIHDNTGLKVDCHAPLSENFWFGSEEFKTVPNVKYGILETKSYGNMALINKMIANLKRKKNRR
jgi:sugar phosphate isomerase/epimerase